MNMVPKSMSQYLGMLVALASVITASVSSHEPATAQSLHSFFARDSVNSSNCQDIQPSFPSNFKCSSDKYCISTDDASTALCCQNGSNCTDIAPITCDIQKQNASISSNSQIFTTRLSDSLLKCGSSCCPFGFECTSDPSTPFCTMVIDKSSLNATSADGGKLSTSTSATAATPSATPTQSSNSIDSTQSLPSGQNKFPAAVFIAGLLPGIVVGVLLTLVWVVCTKRNRTPDAARESSPSFSEHRPIISAPIPIHNSSRTDFIRRAAHKTKSVFSMRGDDRQTQDSNPWNVKMPTPPVPNNVPREMQGTPVTPVNQTAAYRKPSVETIQVYSPPSLIQHPSATVPPLRRMTNQRSMSQTGLGNPFETPPKQNQSDVYEMSGGNGGEVLTPSRYSGAGPREYEDKRGTTFTTMMEHCGIPDRGDQFPVPKIPAQFDSKNRI